MGMNMKKWSLPLGAASFGSYVLIMVTTSCRMRADGLGNRQSGRV
jgi:hypothetical protein